jgi:hypothetical protein
VTPTTTIRDALSNPDLLGNVLSGTSWSAWHTLLIASMGEELRIGELAQFTALTSRPVAPTQRVEELVAVVGRRGGKSRALSVLAAYIAGLCDHRDNLAPGETGVLLIISPNQKQASIALNYCAAAFERSPILKQLIANRNSDTIELTNGVNIEVRAASFRRLRGPTFIGILADEAAFWYSDEFSANPDVEILNACRPGLATTRGPMIVASSPYAKRGVIWDAHKKHYGPDGDPLILVAQGTSRDFNPSLPQSVVDRALERDRASASAEFLAQFRNDIETFVPIEIVEACVGEYRELSPLSEHRYAELVAECLRQVASAADACWDRLEKLHPGDELAQLGAWFREAADHVADSDQRGCALANAAIEIPEKTHPARRVIEEYKSAVRSRLVRLAQTAGLREPDMLADELFLLLEGARVSAQSGGADGLGRRLARMGENLMAAHAHP